MPDVKFPGRRPLPWLPLCLLACLTASGLATVGAPAPARANGTPINVVLTYLSGVSNFGPSSATGTAELLTGEGEVRLTAIGLQPLSGEEYHIWLQNTTTGEWMSLVSAGSAPGGSARVDVVLDRPIPDRGWNLIFLSVETAGSAPHQPNARRAIAGRFPPPGATTGRPGELPRTGGATRTPAETATLAGAFIVLLVGVVGVGVALRRNLGEAR